MGIYKGTNLISGSRNGLHGDFADNDITFTGSVIFDKDEQEDIPAASGGIRIGGNTSSNELFEYEHGSWTPTEGFTNVQCYYVRIGEIVNLWGKMSATSDSEFAELTIPGLPFEISNSNDYRVYGRIWAIADGANSSAPPDGVVSVSVGNTGYFLKLPLFSLSNTSIILATNQGYRLHNHFIGKTFWFNFTYRTDE